MAASGYASYFGREQSLIKHIILEKYLERFAVITGSWCDGIVYVDGFSGPWNVQSEKLDDASFSIALKQLRNARETVRQRFKKELKIKCVFLEKKPDAFARLKRFADEQKDVEVTALNLEFEQGIPELVKIIKSASRGYFPFIFIDPTGWKGFAMETIAPLLRIEPAEVLINFMTGFILRFAEDARDGIDSSFQQLFGNASFRERLKGLNGRAREDALVFEYARRVGEVGRYSYVPITLVPHPVADRTHFHLVYATRSIKGLEVFKDAEKHALTRAGAIRADAQRRDREARTSQSEFLTGSDAPATAYLEELAKHYAALARTAVQQLIRKKRVVPYDAVYATGMCFPLVRLASLRDWIAEIADTENLGPSDRMAKIDSGHRVKLRDGKGQTTELNFDQ